MNRTVCGEIGFVCMLAVGSFLPPFSVLSPAEGQSATFKPVESPEWVNDITRMAFCSPGDLEDAAKAGVQVVHFNLVWPYYPLRKDGGGLSKQDAAALHSFIDNCHRHHMKASLGLPPFPSVATVKAHPDWRIFPDDTGAILKVEPAENNLGTRSPCNLGPWGDYLIQICGELAEDYNIDGFSFDGNYHPRVCYCPYCKQAYKRDTGRDIPAKPDLDEIPYREYLVWRGEKLNDHYQRLQERIKKRNPNAVLMSWTVNAGRYGQLLYSPRAMPTQTNLLFDLPMQEWWMDETNMGGSIVPAFGASYLRAVAGDRSCAAEPYMMSRGNPYGTFSFPDHEQIMRVLLGLTNGSILAEALGWPDHKKSITESFAVVAKRERWITHTKRMPWAAMLMSEQTRQFYAYKDIAGGYLPHVFGTFRAAYEEHLALNLINDWDLTAKELAKYKVVVLANSAALSDAQAQAIRTYVQNGGGLVATCETSLFDELGRPRHDFALADVFGVSYKGHPQDIKTHVELDANFAITVDDNYWKQRSGVADLTWIDHPLTRDPRLNELVPRRTVIFRGPLVVVTEPKERETSVAHMTPEGSTKPPLPAMIVRQFGKGRVVYMANGIDAALWSYAFPYQRRLMARTLEWAAGKSFPISVEAPMGIQTTFFEQATKEGSRLVIHLYNGINTTANHGLTAMDVPLREEAVSVHGIKVRFDGINIKRFHVEPGGIIPAVHRSGSVITVDIPPLDEHAMLVAEK